jgi:hypothetical protein
VCLAGGIALACAVVSGVQGQSARFDLAGPKVEVRVTRAGVTLPIASVPNLQPGDRLWLHPDLPLTQSVRYLMVLAFLRGTTNPPPDQWFIRIETWQRRVREEGYEVTVPKEAQEAVLFLAPVTGGDFSTLRSAVQGRPGVFVRASQDLAAAGFEQGRIEKYIESMHELSSAEIADPKQLQEHSNVIAATLALKPNVDCQKLAADQQYTCFTQTGGQMLLDDGHGQSIVDALTGNTGAGLIGAASTTQIAGAGLYSAYVGTIVDFVHIMGSLHTAQYQYIPAIAFPQQQALNLRLNTPPSFHNPKSVIVIGLPSVQQTTPPPLRAADPKVVSCLQKPDVALPVEGAPLVFSTGFAHDLVLHLNYPGKPGGGEPQDIPLRADASRGGLVLTTIPKRHPLPNLPEEVPASTPPKSAADAAAAGDSQLPVRPKDDIESGTAADVTGAELTGTVKGFWGFDTFTGPTMPLEETPGKDWKLAGDDPLIAGRSQHVIVSSSGTACIQKITLEPVPGKPDGKQEIETWKQAEKPNSVDVAVDVPAHDSGELHLAISQFGEPSPALISLVSYIPPARLDALSFHAGDRIATLTGTSLDQVRQVELGGLVFTPAAGVADSLNAADGKSELRVRLAGNVKTPELAVGNHLVAHVALNDGRTLHLGVVVEAPRPAVTLIGKADVPPDSAPKTAFHIRLASDGDLPMGDSLIFSLKSALPFPRATRIEVASPDGALHTMLGVAGSDSGVNAPLILEDPVTLLATFQPLRAFGASAFGPIRLRAVAPDGTDGDWLPLVTLVRLPSFTSLSCPLAAPQAPPSRTKAAKLPAVASTIVAAASAPDSDADTSDAASAAPPAAAPVPAAAALPAPSAAASAAPSPASCTLSGTGLYFIDSIATDEAFTKSTPVPAGFVGPSIEVPPPTGAAYYLKLRDDPSMVDTVSLPAGPL